VTRPLILVTGATGKTGGAVVRQLRAMDWPVRVLVRKDDVRARDLAALGAQVSVGDLFDRATMTSAMRDVGRAYLVPPFHPRMIHAADLFLEVAEEARLESVVALGQWLASAHHPAFETRQLWQMEQRLAQLGLGVTLVTPGFFADNYLRLIDFAAQLGVLPSLTGDSLNAPPSNEDIAAVVVGSLIDPDRHVGHAYRPTGRTLLSSAAMAEQMSAALGRSVRRFEMPMWLFVKAARMQGVPPVELSGFRHWVRDHKQGAFAYHGVTDHVERVAGRPPEPFAATARRYALLPQAQVSPGSRARAILDFMRTPMASGYDLNRFDREAGVSAPANARYSMQDPVWKASRQRIAETATLPTV